MRLIVARFDHPNSAHAARRRLWGAWPSVPVELARCPEGTELQVVVDDAQEGPALYLLHRCGASLEADLPVREPA